MQTIIESKKLIDLSASVREIFSSIQGEGIEVGKRQLFVRFNGCHLDCVYCDTMQHDMTVKHCEIEPESGSGQKHIIDNPISASTLMSWINYFTEKNRHNHLSLTGGEPLLHTRFLKIFLPMATAKLPIYLETSGTQPDKLSEILPWVDIIAMDIKLPSATGEVMQMENHRLFYELGCNKNIFIKLVVSQETTSDELDLVFEIVAHKTTPIIIQPVTSLKTGLVNVLPKRLFEIEDYLSRYFADVRVIPQTHRMLSVQ